MSNDLFSGRSVKPRDDRVEYADCILESFSNLARF